MALSSLSARPWPRLPVQGVARDVVVCGTLVVTTRCAADRAANP